MRWEQWAKNQVKSKKSLKHQKALRMRHHQHLLKRLELLLKNPRPMAMTNCLHKRMPRAQKMKLKWKTGRKLVSLPKNLPPKTQQQSHKAPLLVLEFMWMNLMKRQCTHCTIQRRKSGAMMDLMRTSRNGTSVLSGILMTMTILTPRTLRSQLV